MIVVSTLFYAEFGRNHDPEDVPPFIFLIWKVIKGPGTSQVNGRMAITQNFLENRIFIIGEKWFFEKFS